MKYDIKSQSEQTQEYIKHELTKSFNPDDSGKDLLSAMLAAAVMGAATEELLSPLDGYKVKKEVLEYAEKNNPQKRTPKWDRTGENYIKQLETDHAEEFGYIYMIERLSNVSFRVVYLNKQTLEPSHCAVITYRTGENPYTTTYSTKLVDMPKNIPPIVRP